MKKISDIIPDHSIMDELLNRITSKKKELDKIKPLREELVKNLDEWYRVELTFTSNAIEGNTLSRAETALVVEKGITVDGKSVAEHLEAINHAEAFDFIKTLKSKKRNDLTEADILDVHRIILSKIDDTNAGRYRSVAVRIAGSTVVMPNPMKVPELMSKFISWVHMVGSHDIAQIAAEAHYKFVSIHPFVDGNGRTARLFMNLLLMQEGYPPAIIRYEDRRIYINAIEKAQLGQGEQDYYDLIYKSIMRSLDIYLDTAKISRY